MSLMKLAPASAVPSTLANSKWLKPFIDLLRQGVSPEKIALTLALGIVLGVTPVLGSTTLLCTLAALLLRLNLPAILLINGLVYPLQLFLLIPFYQCGAWAFGVDVSAISLEAVVTMIRADIGNTIRTLWVVTMHALAVWLVVGALGSMILYALLIPLARRMYESVRSGTESSARSRC
jgi:uncharacterized protein (DUF2062 family)